MDRLAERLGAVQQRDIFRISRGLHAKSAADILSEHAQLFRLDAHGLGEVHAHAADPLGPAAQRVAVAAGVVARARGARLDRGHHQTLVDQFDARHVRGFLERAVEGALLLPVRIGRCSPVEPYIARCLRPELRCARRHCSAHVGHRRHRLIVDDDFFGRVLCHCRVDGNHHRDRLADMHHAAFGQCRPMRPDSLLAFATRNRNGMRDRVVVRRRKICSGEHRDHALRLLRVGGIDAHDLREGVRRAYKKGRKRALRFDVVTEVALAAQERIVLDAS